MTIHLTTATDGDTVTSGVSSKSTAPALGAPGGAPVAAFAEAISGSMAWLEGLRDRGLDLTLKAHLKTVEEASELAESLSIEEYADVIICLAAVGLSQRWTLDEITAAIKAKNQTNRNRIWEQMPDGTWHHVTLQGNGCAGSNEPGQTGSRSEGVEA